MPAHIVDTTFVAGAGGSVRFYQPGTLIQATVYSNDAATAILSQPIALDANGKTVFPVYTIAPVRAVFFDSNGAQLADVERDNGERAEITSLVNARWPNAENVDEALTELALSLGSTDGNSTASFQGAVPRTVQARLQDQVNVKDFGAKGDGVTLDDQAFQNALVFLQASTVGRVGVLRVPAGTYALSSTVAVNLTSGEATIQGDGKGATVLRFTSPTANGIAPASFGFPLNVKDLSITHATTSTGAGINTFNAGGQCVFSNLSISGFRTGIAFLQGTAFLVDVATDNNAAGSAFTVAADPVRILACSCNVNSAASVGVRILSSSLGDLSIIGCKLPNAASRGVLFETGSTVLTSTIVGNAFGIQFVNVGGITVTDTGTLKGARMAANVGNYSVVEAANSTDIITNPVAGILSIDLQKSLYQKATIVAATAITYFNPNPGAGRSHDDTYTIVLQNSTGGGFAITAGTNVTLQTGGFTVAATSQSVIHMQYDSNANRLIQVTTPVAMAVT